MTTYTVIPQRGFKLGDELGKDRTFPTLKEANEYIRFLKSKGIHGVRANNKTQQGIYF